MAKANATSSSSATSSSNQQAQAQQQPKPLTPTQAKMLAAIAGGATTRKAMQALAGLPRKGYSAALGAPSKGALLPHTLGGRGFVSHSYANGVLVYTLTTAGKAHLAAQQQQQQA